MTDMKHTPTPWKVVSDPHFDSGLVYTSIQPVNIDEEAMKPLAMMNGEYHVCRMSHTAAPWRFNYHRENAEFIVTAVNAYYPQQTELEALHRRVEELEAENAWLKLAMTPVALAAQTAGTAWLDTETVDRLPHVGSILKLGYLRNIAAALMDAKEREE